MTIVVAALVGAGLACQPQARPDPRVDELAARIQAIEATQARIVQLLEALERVNQVAETLGQEVSGRAQGDPEVRAHIERLEQRVAELERAEPPPPAAPPPRPGVPDPDAVYAVPIAGHPFDGPKDAPITIVEAFQFACPFCHRVRPTLDQLMQDYPGKIRIVYRQFIIHPKTATLPAQAACAAHKQRSYLAMHERLWSWTWPADGSRNLNHPTEADMEALAREAGLDVARFRRDLTGACVTEVQANQKELASFGVRGTPAFFINGRFLSGAQPIDRFKALIDEELARVEEAKQRRVKPRDYYSKEVLGKGKKGLN